MTDDPTVDEVSSEETSGTPTLRSTPDLVMGQRIDHYIIREQLGEGGFATVYLAQQTEPVARTVALKII